MLRYACHNPAASQLTGANDNTLASDPRIYCLPWTFFLKWLLELPSWFQKYHSLELPPIVGSDSLVLESPKIAIINQFLNLHYRNIINKFNKSSKLIQYQNNLKKVVDGNFRFWLPTEYTNKRFNFLLNKILLKTIFKHFYYHKKWWHKTKKQKIERHISL